MKNKHTPGPWSIWTSNSYRRIGSDTTGCHVVSPVTHPYDHHPDLHFPNGGFDGPDARLIAAAPELLEALQDVKGMIYAMNMSDTPVGLMVSTAIAKATGEELK